MIVRLAAMRGDAELFEEYRRRFESASTPAERSRFLLGMRQFAEPAIRKRVREYALTGAVRPTEIITLVGDSDSAAERDDLFQWVTANYDALMKKLPPNFTGSMAFIAGGCEPDRVERARVAEGVNECASLRAREIEAVTRYLSGR